MNILIFEVQHNVSRELLMNLPKTVKVVIDETNHTKNL